MERRSRRPWSVEFTRGTKKQINREQEGRCALCGAEGNLQYHHCVPVAHGGTRDRKNGVGVCPPDHKLLDRLALRYGIYYPMEPGVEYSLDYSEKSGIMPDNLEHLF